MARASYWFFIKAYQLVLPKDGIHATSTLIAIGITNDTSSPIIDLLRDIRSTTATDPKDKVFSILGLAAEAIESKDTRLLPNYSKSTIQVYRDITRYVIETDLNLNILSLAGMRQNLTDEATNFPSWVPRFDLDSWMGFDGSGLHKTSNNLPPCLLPSLDEDALILRGIRFDSLLSDGRHWFQRIKDLIEDLEMFETMWNNIANEAIAYSEGKDRLWALYMTLTTGETATFESADNNASHLADIWAYEKQLFEEAKVRRRKPSDRIELWGEEIYAANPTGSATRFKQAVTVLSSNLVLFTTAKGYIGLGPPSMLEGDIICILFGGEVPYVLRPMGSHWQLVGECYVHGIMQGEGLKDFNGDMSQTEIFEIR
ncbi:hypothetical protein LARI1_G005623 [Lachnellula arida]|uniref:Heterokaryon incompatibility domain-containing protein n=1 Tax=Lachnellula arida TaxID=1316785 RepID=A0A8T9BAX6_9HELO|nr:hypothetical protein LARI1_G005623 [Lachnellula arida]